MSRGISAKPFASTALCCLHCRAELFALLELIRPDLPSPVSEWKCPVCGEKHACRFASELRLMTEELYHLLKRVYGLER
jgi:hypothetical protein